MNQELKKVIRLAKKTGDRIIIFDQEQEGDSYVIMPVEEYERIIIGKNEVRGLTEDKLLDKINRDIAIWKSEQKQDNYLDNILTREEQSYFSKVDEILANYKYKTPEKDTEKKSRSFWTIPQERKEGAEEIIEEDRQYLEEVKY